MQGYLYRFYFYTRDLHQILLARAVAVCLVQCQIISMA